MDDDRDIIIIDSVTKFPADSAGRPAIAASHGGVYAGYLAAKAGVRGVVLHDAGIGRDEAGIGALAYLDKLSIAGATVEGASARIGDGAALAAGRISRVNRTAAAAGCAPGQSGLDCARAMRAAPGASGPAPDYAEARFVIREAPGEPKVIGCDSTSLVRPEDAGAVVVTASHGELLKGDPSWGKRPDVLAAVFNDAGQTTVSRLADLDGRAIAGATVSTASARIGDARSTWEDGIVSHVNDTARRHGGQAGMTCRDFVEATIASARS